MSSATVAGADGDKHSIFTAVDFIAKIVFAIAILLIAYCDFGMTKLIQISDYTCTFYTAGRLIALGRIAELYPKLTDQTLAGTVFDKAAHQFLPHLPPHVVAIFPYPPIVALTFVPLGLLSPNISLLCFQALCVVSLFLACGCLLRFDAKVISTAMPYTALFTPVLLITWIGQLDMVAGVAVWALSFFALQRQRYFLAGLIGALALFKPQLALAPFLVAAVLLCRKQPRMIAGFVCGAIVLVALTLGIFGLDVCKLWLGAAALTEKVYLSPTSGVARHLAVSVPRFILFTVPAQLLPVVKPITYGLAGLLILGSIFLCWRRTRALSETTAVKLAFVIGSLLIPLAAPHLFYYDLCVWIVPGLLIMAGDFTDFDDTKLRLRALTLWLIVAVYPFLFRFTMSMYLPLVILVPLALVYAEWLRFGWSRPQEPPKDHGGEQQQNIVDNAD